MSDFLLVNADRNLGFPHHSTTSVRHFYAISFYIVFASISSRIKDSLHALGTGYEKRFGGFCFFYLKRKRKSAVLQKSLKVFMV